MTPTWSCAWLFFLSLVFTQDASAAVKLKLSLTNPSITEEKIMPLKSYLPKEVEPEMVLDKGSLQIGYDYRTSLYYVYQEAKLKPQETVIFEITLKDIWFIPEEELTALELHVTKLIPLLKGASSEQAKILGDSIITRLRSIKEGQASGEVSTEERFSAYEINIGALKMIKKDIATLEDLVLIATGGLPDKIRLGESGDEPVISAKEMIAGLDLENSAVVKFGIEVSNPSTQPKVTPVKLYLPAEVSSQYIVDADGLEIGYDYKKALCYVFKDSISLAPKEDKKFIVRIKDIWVIPEERILELKTRIKNLKGALVENTEYSSQAGILADKTIALLDEILAIQGIQASSVEWHIGDYRGNLKKFASTKREMLKLEALLSQIGARPAETFKAEDIAVGKEAKAGQGSSPEKTSELVRGARGLKLVAGTFFRGKAPTVTTTWGIIWVIIIFLGVISFLFFILWWLQARK
ncbi:MAG: hypothetical protein V1650_04285 [Candidatus Omnitrophota bacterium]